VPVLRAFCGFRDLGCILERCRYSSKIVNDEGAIQVQKQFLRKSSVARRYDVTPRTVERMVDDGRLPPPIYRGRMPQWDEAELDAADRAATVGRRRKNVSTEVAAA
jgi:predicted DNA-binding transcriptional regulator AlpA